jgi:hypothetical protein
MRGNKVSDSGKAVAEGSVVTIFEDRLTAE